MARGPSPPARVAPTLAVALVVLGLAPGSAGAAPSAPEVTHGTAVGDVTDTSAVVWARADREATLHVALSGGRHGRLGTARAVADDDYTARIPLDDLAPGTTYRYRAWFSLGPPGLSHGAVATGSFETAPANDDPAALRLDFGGDLAGQNVCRDTSEGFPTTETVHARHPDVFIGLGDMIYGDDTCSAVGRYGNTQIEGGFGRATDLAGFWAHYHYNRADPHLQGLLQNTDYVGVWDDHEVLNDFGPVTDVSDVPPYTAGVHLMPFGLQAFLDYTPVMPSSDPNRLYRSFRWGKNAEVFVLDTRQYRDANFAPDSDAHPKTMLGAAQLSWLKEGLASSDATWKVIISSVPMSIPTGFPPTNGRDGWANFDQDTGFEHELLNIVNFMHSNGIDNTVWITTDIHFAEAFQYVPFPDDSDFVIHEMATGPMNAGIFPINGFDPTLRPELLTRYAPNSSTDVRSWSDARHWFNFGELDFAGDKSLTMRIIDSRGEIVFERTLTPVRRQPPNA